MFQFQFEYTSPRSGNVYAVSVEQLKGGQINVSAALLTRKHGERDETRRGAAEIEFAIGQECVPAAAKVAALGETAFFSQGRLYTSLAARTSAPQPISAFLP